MEYRTSELLYRNRRYLLMLLGVTLIAVGNSISFEVWKIRIDHLVSEIGALFLVVGTLHWMFEYGLRREMLKDISDAVLGNEKIGQSGLIDIQIDSKEVREIDHWKRSKSLVIGMHYSDRFFEDHQDVIDQRCMNQLDTTLILIDPTSKAADYLKVSASGTSSIESSLEKVNTLITESVKKNLHRVKVFEHQRVLRYTFIYTEEAVWVKLFTNSKGRAHVPALKIQAGSPLFEFFKADIGRLTEQARLKGITACSIQK
ncbi:MAG: hypothetical protein ACREDR_02700 [Blastocatellia bacterium]